MSFFHYLIDRFVKESQLKISVFDLSVLRGYGVFEFLRTYGDKPFRLEEHLDRFFTSAKIVGIPVPKKRKQLKKIVYNGIEKNIKTSTNHDLSIRIILTGGVGPDSVTPGKPSLIVIFSKVKVYPKKYYQKGVKVITFKTSRFLAKAKSLNYLMAVVALQEAKKNGAVEALYIDEGAKIFEATTSNFFVVANQSIITPKSDILLGITRKVVLEIAKEEKIKTIEKELFISQIKDFDEAFLTATEKEIMPVVKIDNEKVGDGKVGETTKRLMVAFLKKNLKPPQQKKAKEIVRNLKISLTKKGPIGPQIV